MTSERKIFSLKELVIFLVALLVIAYIILKTSGGSVYEREETTQVTQNPSTVGGKTQSRNYVMKDEERVEVILQQLSEQLSDKNIADPKEGIDYEEVIPDDEMSYLEKLREKHKSQEKTSNPADWLAILQASHQTYSKIRSIFEESDPSGKKLRESNITKTLENAAASRLIYSKIEEVFGIPQEDARQFAEKGKKAVSDWAEFVEQNKQKKEQ